MIEPIGLTVPDCLCWKKQAKEMELAIDTVASIMMHEALRNANNIQICPVARDYYIAAIMFTMISALIPKRPDDKDYRVNPIASYRQDFESVYDRLRPLVMQRIDHADAMVDEVRG